MVRCSFAVVSVLRRPTFGASRNTLDTLSFLQPEETVWLAVAAYAAYGHLRLASREAAHQSHEQICTLLREWGGLEPTTVLRPSTRR